MTNTRRVNEGHKTGDKTRDKILELHRAGYPTGVIAERFGLKRRTVTGIITTSKSRESHEHQH